MSQIQDLQRSHNKINAKIKIEHLHPGMAQKNWGQRHTINSFQKQKTSGRWTGSKISQLELLLFFQIRKCPKSAGGLDCILGSSYLLGPLSLREQSSSPGSLKVLDWTDPSAVHTQFLPSVFRCWTLLLLSRKNSGQQFGRAIAIHIAISCYLCIYFDYLGYPVVEEVESPDTSYPEKILKRITEAWNKHKRPHAFDSHFNWSTDPTDLVSKLKLSMWLKTSFLFFSLWGKKLPDFVTLSLSNVTLKYKDEINVMTAEFMIYIGYFYNALTICLRHQKAGLGS